MEKKKSQEKIYTKPLLVLIAFSALIRALVAAFTELGNDEVYYLTYALFPDISHFDHPPMVGFLIQLSTLDMLLQSEFFIRLGGIVLGSINTWMIYLTAKNLFNARSGWLSALLYTASIYAGIISNTFILPDTPQGFFWILSLYLLSESMLSKKPMNATSKNLFFLSGVSIGLAVLSKYTSVFLWSGLGLYILISDRRWLKTKELYFAVVASIFLALPILFWNMEHDFISLSFHSGRVGLFSSGLRPDYFGTEIAGQAFYNNPVVFVLIWLAIIFAFQKKRFLKNKNAQFLLLTALPLIGIFLFFALFKRTLPHWTGPAYITLIPLAAWRLDSIMKEKGNHQLIPPSVNAALMLFLLVILLGFLQINTGLFYHDEGSAITNVGKKDPSLDMYGWKQLGMKFKDIAERDINAGEMPPNSFLLSHKWFPAANLEHYVARPAGFSMKTLGHITDTHKYHWISQERGGINPGDDFYYITGSHLYTDPLPLYGKQFEEIIPTDTVKIYRSGKIAEYFFVYRLMGYKAVED